MMRWLMFLDIVPDPSSITDRSLSGDFNLDEDNPVPNTVHFVEYGAKETLVGK
jgi:hypothetical protein